MSIDVMLSILKFAAILLTGILAVIGLLVDYKDERGKITKWGRRALIAVIISSLVATFTQGIEVYKQRRDAKEADARRQEENQINNKLLTEISRAVYPLVDLNVTASANFPLTHPDLKGYFQRLDKGARACTQSSNSKQCAGLDPFMSVDENDKTQPIGAIISQKSPLFPMAASEKLARRMMSVFGVEMRIFKTPIDLNEYSKGDEREEPDFHFRVRADEVSSTYMFAESNIELYAERMKVDRNDLNSNGSITSITDLSNAQMFIYFYDYDTGDDNIDYPYLEVEQGAELRSMLLYIGNRKFPIEGFKKLPNTKYPTYVYTFPSDMERTNF